MSRLLKRFLAVTARIILVGGPLLAILMLVAGALGVFGDQSWFAQAGVGITMALYILFWSLLSGGVLRLLLSIDDRLERLEGKF